MKIKAVICGVLVCLLAAGVWAQEKKKADMEGQVRAAGFRCFAGNVLGAFDEIAASVRFPLIVVRDGVVKNREEAESRALTARTAENIKKANLSEDDRKHMSANMVGIFDEASVQFIGANTATITFLIKH